MTEAMKTKTPNIFAIINSGEGPRAASIDGKLKFPIQPTDVRAVGDYVEMYGTSDMPSFLGRPGETIDPRLEGLILEHCPDGANAYRRLADSSCAGRSVIFVQFYHLSESCL